MKNKYYKDFFIYKKKHHWYILPAFVFYYDKDEYFSDGKTSPSWGFTVRWLQLMVGFQIQKNPDNHD